MMTPAHKIAYKFKRIISINSGSACYVDVPLDRHALITAKGNSGKSSLLNALKFFCLPETNFKKAAKKFKLVDRQSETGFYNGNETYSYYFPTEQSFIILEGANGFGTYCQILYGRQNMSYGRLMVSCDFEGIKDLFWTHNKENYGIGQPNQQLNVRYVKDQLKIRNLPFEEVTQAAKLPDILYNDSMLDNDSRYALFPLRGREESDIATLATMIHALCGFKTGGAELANLIACVIESQKKDNGDHLELDIAHILDERDSILRQEAELVNLISHQTLADNIKSHSARLTELKGTLGYSYNCAAYSVNQNIIKAKKEVQEYTEKSNKLHLMVKNARAVRIEVNSALQEQKGARKVLKDANKDLSCIVEKGDAVLSEFAIYGSLDNITDQMKITINDFEDEKALLLDSGKQATELENIGKEIIQLKKTSENLTSTINNNQDLLADQISEHAASVLCSINPKFKQVSVHDLNESDREKIEVFSELFVSDEKMLNFFNVSILKQNNGATMDELLAERKQVEDEINEAEKTYSKLLEMLGSSPESVKKSIEKIIKDIAELKNDIKLLNSLESQKDYLSKNNSQLAECELEITDLEVKVQESVNRLSELKDGYDRSVKESERISRENQHWKDLEKRLVTASNTSIFKEVIDSTLESTPKLIEVNESIVDTIANEMNTYKTYISSLHMMLKDAVNANLVKDDLSQLHKVNQTLNDVKHLCDMVSDRFDEIPVRKENIKSDKNRHKSTLALKTQELVRNASLIQRRQESINRQYKQIKINNLEEVRVVIQTDSRFSELVAQIEHDDFYGSSSISDEFYDRLSSFSEAFFFGDESKVLKMTNIITNVSFETRKPGGKLVSTGQSNSTVSLIGVTLLQKMLKGIMNPDIDLSIPLSFDELSHIDESEISWLLNSLREDGFSLLGASTNNISPYTVNLIKTHCPIDGTHAQQTYSVGRTLFFKDYEGLVL